MGYYIRSLKNKKSRPRWKVQFVSYQKKDSKNSYAKKPKKEWDVDKDRWRPLGILPTMTIEEARCRAKQLNAQENFKKQERRLQKLKEKKLGFI